MPITLSEGKKEMKFKDYIIVFITVVVVSFLFCCIVDYFDIGVNGLKKYCCVFWGVLIGLYYGAITTGLINIIRNRTN